MVTVLSRDRTTIAPDGSITLPQHIREAGLLKAGETLAVWWLPPDQIILRKVTATDEAEFAKAMDEFRTGLASTGYDTEEKVNLLIRQIKEEQAQEWTSQRPQSG